MDQLLPMTDDEIDAADVVRRERREHADGRPWVLSNLVVGLDGGIEIEHRSRPLSSDADRELFQALRSVADVVLVGASTARLERYRLPVVASTTLEAGGRAPTLCVVSGSLDFDVDLPFLDHGLDDPDSWPLIVTGNTASPDRVRALDGRAHVIQVDSSTVEPPGLLDQLARRGATTVLCEGGPTLLSQLGAHGLLDEWNLSIAPLLAGGGAARLSAAGSPTLGPLRLDRLLVAGSHLFARYLTSPGVAGVHSPDNASAMTSV